METDSHTGDKFRRLVEIMARLRSPGGCPWDAKQTFDTIKSYLVEETYEVLDAVDARNWDALREELGDLMLQAVFFARMAQEENRFQIGDSLDTINEKLVRRHPHVFADGDAKTPEEVKRRWDQIKAEEKAERNGGPVGLLASVPRSMPALVEASQIASRAAGVGSGPFFSGAGASAAPSPPAASRHNAATQTRQPRPAVRTRAFIPRRPSRCA